MTPKRRKPVKRAQRQQTPLLQRWVLRHGVPLLSFPRPLVPEHDRQVWIPCWRALVEAATNRAFRISPHALGKPCAPLISLAKIAGEGVAQAGTGGCAGYGFGLRAHGRFRCPVICRKPVTGPIGSGFLVNTCRRTFRNVETGRPDATGLLNKADGKNRESENPEEISLLNGRNPTVALAIPGEALRNREFAARGEAAPSVCEHDRNDKTPKRLPHGILR